MYVVLKKKKMGNYQQLHNTKQLVLVQTMGTVFLYNTVEPQSYGLHSYGKLGQPDTEIEYIFGKYHQNFYKMGTGHQV